ncbi:hypothetical protein ISN45_At02g005580 [Arabidopsis thaliana x Arabidopsis arenosa]|uniref:Mutator-like transposase n=1 Tax=Arabidopsis thaliana x Arabidopsis arenosa TaxID=1240361 RepID=A0A8T2FKS3_9BRAS|nr:hypothetical protein ISN45_At02g005580 [Arabidopsis thaliana x Arabidopsis arenosa]
MSEEVPMGSYCMVICGEWECSDIQEWYFEINKILMSRIVPITAGMNLSSLEDIVWKEFMNKDLTFGTPRFSYLPSNIMDYTTGKKIPPILITSEVGLKFFIEMFGRNKGLNLFVTFSEMIEIGNSRRKNVREEDFAGSIVMKSKKRAILSSCEGLARSDDDFGWKAPTAGSKTPKIPTTQDDDAVIAEVEVLEAIEEEVEDGENVDEVAPTGFDTEFWGHFLDDELAGSNAPEIMCSPRVARTQEDKDCNDGRGSSTDSETMPNGGQRNRETRKIDDIEDEEFDIPPLFDDIEYERDEIPNLDIEDDEKSRTKRHYFVITCADENCQWRIMSHEMKTCGYYQIRKADLEHTCNIETRGQYMKMATSRVITSVYKAKYNKFSERHVPLDLQQMVLEDLRVTTSYGTCWRAKEKAMEEVIVVDGSHLTGKYKRVLLTASGQDGNFQISMKNSECASYLERSKTRHWTRVYFQGERYNLMTSNISETLNSALRKGRGSPILKLLRFIRAMITRWFSSRRKKSIEHTGLVTREVDKVLTKNLAKVRGSKIGKVSTWSYEIVGMLNGKNQVCLDRRQCTYKEYNNLKIPCGHAMLAATSVGQSYGSLIADFYKTIAWRATYKGVINSELNLEDVDVPNEIGSQTIFPPWTRRSSGRPKMLCIKSIGEYSYWDGLRTVLDPGGRVDGRVISWSLLLFLVLECLVECGMEKTLKLVVDSNMWVLDLSASVAASTAMSILDLHSSAAASTEVE